MSERFPGIDWHCDRCNAYLNDQAGFDDNKYTWVCKECGYKNSISRTNIFSSSLEFFKLMKDVRSGNFELDDDSDDDEDY